VRVEPRLSLTNEQDVVRLNSLTSDLAAIGWQTPAHSPSSFSMLAQTDASKLSDMHIDDVASTEVCGMPPYPSDTSLRLCVKDAFSWQR
jgi:hypothetical protein